LKQIDDEIIRESVDGRECDPVMVRVIEPPRSISDAVPVRNEAASDNGGGGNRMDSERGRATLAGLGAIGLWALLAPLGVAAGPVPPFLLTALSFAVGGTVGLVLQLAGRHSTAALLRVPTVA
jgi:hypothetical protein